MSTTTIELPSADEPESSSPLLDKIVAEADVMRLLSNDEGQELFRRLTGVRPSPETWRRWKIGHRVIGGERRYRAEDIVEFARKRLEQAPYVK